MEGACIVMDVGSGSVKAELASAELPKTYSNVVGTIKHHALMPEQAPGLVNDNMFVGNHCDEHRGLLKLAYPMEHGHVTDWDSMQRVMRHVSDDLVGPSKDHPVLVTEAPNASADQRNRIAQIVFEELQHPSLVLSVQAVLSLYSSGLTTGVVLDIGDGVTHACPVVEGYSVREAVRRVDFGGRDVTSYLQLLLRQHGTYLDTSAEFDIVRQIKEQRCQVAQSAKKNESATAVKHRLPDGTEVTLGAELRQAPELLFDPSLHGYESPSVVSVVTECIRRCDVDLRSKLFESIYLAGGTTLMPRFCERFLSETVKLTPRHCKVKVHAPAERRYTTWIGGSFLAQLSSFQNMLTKKAEYYEQGERVLYNRMFA
jgi:centractin